MTSYKSKLIQQYLSLYRQLVGNTEVDCNKLLKMTINELKMYVASFRDEVSLLNS